MEYEYVNSEEKELLRKLHEAIWNLEDHLNRKEFPNYCLRGFTELHAWNTQIENAIRVAFKRDENAPHRSSNSETAIDKQD